MSQENEKSNMSYIIIGYQNSWSVKNNNKFLSFVNSSVNGPFDLFSG